MFRQFCQLAMITVMIAPQLPAQDACSTCCTDYRVVCQTVYEEKPITTRKLQSRTVYDERQVVKYRPTWETTVRTRRYTVQKPVMQTSMREERKTVMKPVWEVRYKDMSYNQVKYVAQTSTRTERRVVQKPVTETYMKEERRVVQRPVTETVVQDQVSTVYRPVTNYYERTVDQGNYVDQYQYKPGDVRHRLRWQNAQCRVDPKTGESGVQRAGLYWVPKQAAGTYEVNKVYVPNPVTQQLAQTQYVPQQVTQKIPVSVTRMMPEIQARRVPVQVVKMVAEEQIREVPVTVQRPVVETIPKFVPEYRCRWVPQEYVRQVPVNTYKYVSEERVEEIPVRTCKMVAEKETIQVPRKETFWVEETVMQTIPRRVMMKVPIDAGYSFAPSVSGVESATTDYATVDSPLSTSPAKFNVHGVSDQATTSDTNAAGSTSQSSERIQLKPPTDTKAGVTNQPSIVPVPTGSRPELESGRRAIHRTNSQWLGDGRSTNDQDSVRSARVNDARLPRLSQSYSF